MVGFMDLKAQEAVNVPLVFDCNVLFWNMQNVWTYNGRTSNQKNITNIDKNIGNDG